MCWVHTFHPQTSEHHLRCSCRSAAHSYTLSTDTRSIRPNFAVRQCDQTHSTRSRVRQFCLCHVAVAPIRALQFAPFWSLAYLDMGINLKWKRVDSGQFVSYKVTVVLTIAECVFGGIQCMHRLDRGLRVVAGILTGVAEFTRGHRIQQLAAIIFAVHRIQIGFGPVWLQSLVQIRWQRVQRLVRWKRIRSCLCGFHERIRVWIQCQLIDSETQFLTLTLHIADEILHFSQFTVECIGGAVIRRGCMMEPFQRFASTAWCLQFLTQNQQLTLQARITRNGLFQFLEEGHGYMLIQCGSDKGPEITRELMANWWWIFDSSTSSECWIFFVVTKLSGCTRSVANLRFNSARAPSMSSLSRCNKCKLSDSSCSISSSSYSCCTFCCNHCPMPLIWCLHSKRIHAATYVQFNLPRIVLVPLVLIFGNQFLLLVPLICMQTIEIVLRSHCAGIPL